VGSLNALIIGLGTLSELIGGLYGGLSRGLQEGLSAGLSKGLVLGLSYWLLLGFFQGIKSEQIDDQDRHVPNQGVHRSVYNSLLFGMISGAFITLMVGLSFGLSTGLIGGLTTGLSEGWQVWLSYWRPQGMTDMVSAGPSSIWFVAGSGALFVCAASGGLATLRHYVIRLVLARSHSFPWQAVTFLDDATTRILLQHVGGGYSFTHRLLLDYFADLHTDTPSS
jgi:hypothetical protein